VLPNGSIYVSSELLASLENEAGLASVLGHEIAHYVRRHALVEALYANHSTSTVDRMKLSRKHEREADRMALELMSERGYDPSEMIRVLRLVAKDEVVDPGRVYAWESHPAARERIRDLKGDLWAGPWRTYGDDGDDRYGTAVADLLLANAQLELDEGHLDRARASIDRHLAQRPQSGRGYYLRAEYERLTLEDGRFAPEVLAGYERAHALAPDDPKIDRALGFLLEELGATGRARPILESYLALVPDAPDRKLVERYLAEALGP
jgi:predicted Zn-dependent protease